MIFYEVSFIVYHILSCVSTHEPVKAVSKIRSVLYVLCNTRLMLTLYLIFKYINSCLANTRSYYNPIIQTIMPIIVS